MKYASKFKIPNFRLFIGIRFQADNKVAEKLFITLTPYVLVYDGKPGFLFLNGLKGSWSPLGAKPSQPYQYFKLEAN